jgi:hypothetical protein
MTPGLFVLVTVSALFGAACATRLETQPLKVPLPMDKPTPGVVVYPPRLVKVTYEFSVLVDGDGKVLGRSPKECEVSHKDELRIMPDFRSSHGIGSSTVRMGVNEIQCDAQ